MSETPKISQNRIELYFLILTFIISFLYFLISGGTMLFFQSEQNLFIFSVDYLKDFLLRPGGILEYSGIFFTQIFSTPLFGSLIIAGIITLTGYMMIQINKCMNFRSPASLILVLFSISLMFLMQVHYYHPLTGTIGIIVILTGLWLQLRTRKKYLFTILLPALYYLTGAYAVVYLCMIMINNIMSQRGKARIYLTLSAPLLFVITFLLFRDVLFSVPVEKLLTYPLPLNGGNLYRVFFAILLISLIIYPLYTIPGQVSILRKFSAKPAYTLATGLFLILLCFLLYLKINNPQTNRVLTIEELAFKEKWNELIEFNEKYPSENLIGQYYYNIALSETDQLCDKMFSGRQDFGTGSLIMPWSDKHLSWGAGFFYSAGLINEAHRWAYEEMVVYGIRPHNMKMLVKTSIICGDFQMAKKYTGILKKTRYRAWAQKYEGYLKDTISIKTDNDLGKKMRLMPSTDFFILLDSPEENLPKLIEANPDNHKAFEYLMGWLMLSKNIEVVVSNSIKFKELGYSHLPKHIEEAILIYQNSKGVYPESGGLTISRETMERFDNYFRDYIAARKIPSTLKENMKKYSNTFWYYYHFS